MRYNVNIYMVLAPKILEPLHCGFGRGISKASRKLEKQSTREDSHVQALKR